MEKVFTFFRFRIFVSSCLLLFIIASCSDSSNSEENDINRSVGEQDALDNISGDVSCVLNPYEEVNWETWSQYKANFHTHTTNSDGKQPPSTVIDEYHFAGYSILAITDHNFITWPWTDYGRDPKALNMLAVRGDEYSNSQHMNAYFDFTISSSNLQKGIPHVYEKGGLCIINHPGRYKKSPEWHIQWYKKYPSCIGMEVLNQGERYEKDRRLWDSVNDRLFKSEGRLVWGYSNDDKHRKNHLYRNFQFMIMPELTETALKISQQNGASYFCIEPKGSGNAYVPRVEQIKVDNVNKTIAISAHDYDSISWFGPGTREVARGATFDFKNYKGRSFVRAVLYGPQGACYSQPFGFKTVATK